MKRLGMFKALICSGTEEYGFPFIPEKYRFFKWSALILLISVFGYLLINPPVRVSENIRLKNTNKFDARVDEFGMTRLHRAVIRGKTNIVKLLLRNGADPDAVDNYGWSSLHWSSFLKRDNLSRILISGGAREDVRSTADWFVFRKGSIPGDLIKGR